MKVDLPEKIKRVPFNEDNPNLMGHDAAAFPKPTYHAVWDESKGYPAPKAGRPL